MTTSPRWFLCATLAIGLASPLLSSCGKRDDAPSTAQPAPGPSSTAAQGTTPPPAGDSTPKAADADTRQAVGANEKTGSGGGSQQSNVGTAASGAPPYTLNSAPEGNQAPSQGTKAGEPAKK